MTSAPFRTVETHLSWLVLVGDRVLKAKKPVTTAYVDLSTRTARRRVAERETALNRRLAPDVYLGVATLHGAGLDEPVVVMRRMPGDRRLATLARSGADLRPEVAALARLLAHFHDGVDPVPAAGTPEAVGRLWRDNTAELLAAPGPLDPGQVRRVQALAERWLAGREPLLAQRRAAGRSRDGHGDLLADDVFLLEDGPRVLDCLEFDDRLRAGDVLADVACLAMDLERLGRRDLARLLLATHRGASGDDWPDALADHWTAYRAQVRCKVAVLRAAQGDQAGAALAHDLLDLAERRLVRAQLRVVLVGGSPGTGKSTLAAGLGEVTGWPVLRSDVVRRELTPGAGTGELDRGRYAPEVSERVLAELLARLAELLGAGRSAVLDATWADPRARERVADVARAAGAGVLALRTWLPDDVADTRLARRQARGDDASEAGTAVARALRRRAQPWPEAVPLDTRPPAGSVVTAALAVLAGDGWVPEP